MCGISGVLSPNSEIREKIYQINNSMIHRGPDDEGYFKDERISLGVRRLSINDVPTGHQPISNENDTIHLICNGEIYNSPQLRKELISKGHTFKTRNDVEVILHLYEEFGKNCVEHLRGMFAFAIWNGETKNLFIARDHLGQKPLYFCSHNSAIVFASEIKGILSAKLFSPEIDFNGLSNLISLRYIPGQLTLFKDINKLPAGHWLSVENGKLDIQKYWELNFNSKLSANEFNIVGSLDELLNDTIKQHLLSDVPLGTFLSGGIDSSLISAIISKQTGGSVPAYTIGVEDARFNEIPYAQKVASQYKLDFNYEIVHPDLIHLIPEMIYHMEEPADPFGVGVFLASKFAAKDIKVIIGGDGGDENFAGYDRYIGQSIVQYYSILPAWIRKLFVKRALELIPKRYGYKTVSQKMDWLNDMSFYHSGERYAKSLSILRFTPEYKRQLFTTHVLSQLSEIESLDDLMQHFNSNNASELVDRMLYTDLMTRVPDHLLMVVDRMTMAHSIESRSPLIDYKITEFAASIPAVLKLKNRKLKYMLKKVSYNYLPADIVDRPKQGFAFPIGKWLQNEFSVLLRNLSSSSRFVEMGFFRKEFIDQIIKEHISGKKDHNYRLWILINLEIWYKLFFENYSIDDAAEMLEKISMDTK
jgi:asparagine synthase (glutamine-hydrolysing)